MTLLLATLACQALTGGAAEPTATRPPRPTRTEAPPPTETEAPTEVPTEEPTDVPDTGAVIMEDDFSSNRWGTGTDADSSIEYAGGTLQFFVYTSNWFTWSTPNNNTYQDVHLEVTVISNGTDATTAFGLMCNQQAESSSFYYVAITPAGEYAIARAAPGEDDFFLTNDNEWGSSDLIPEDAETYRVGADCGHGTLTLYVDGQVIDSVTDEAYTEGGVALFVWSGEEATNTDVAFDDFLMTELP
jgi:hypothetical protein